MDPVQLGSHHGVNALQNQGLPSGVPAAGGSPSRTPGAAPFNEDTFVTSADPTIFDQQARATTSTSYTVKPGDTLSEIAANQGVGLDELLRANPQIENPDLIYPGQQINLPSRGGEPAPPRPEPAPPATYTVRAGDTLSEIAGRHGVTTPELIRANPQIENPDLIYPGQQINLPAGSRPQPTDPAGPTNPTNPATPTPPFNGNLIYADRVSPEFGQKVVDIAGRLGMDPNHLMAVMAFESNFNPQAVNAASGATGLIQFLPSTARGLGTTTAELRQMSAEQQLDYVERYLQPYAGRMNTIEDAYMAVFYPAAIGRSNDSALFSQGTEAYRLNAALDINRDGTITKGEAATYVRQRYEEGLRG